MPDARLSTARTGSSSREWKWLRHGFSFLSTIPQIFERKSQSLENKSEEWAAVVAWWHQGLSASHDPDQHTLQARSASRIEDGLVEHRRSNRVTESDQDMYGIKDVGQVAGYCERPEAAPVTAAYTN